MTGFSCDASVDRRVVARPFSFRLACCQSSCPSRLSPTTERLTTSWNVVCSPGLLLFNPYDAKEVFRFASGVDLSMVLGDTFGFEFYVTDETVSYCVCFNHHDMLLGAGAVESWVESLR